MTTAAIDVSWNEVINVFGQSRVEDNVSVFESAFAKIHDNYIQGAYPTTVGGPLGQWDHAGQRRPRTTRCGNQIVETTNTGIGIAAAGTTRCTATGSCSTASSTMADPVAAASVGVFVWNHDGNPNWANNSAWGTWSVGCVRAGIETTSGSQVLPQATIAST